MKKTNMELIMVLIAALLVGTLISVFPSWRESDAGQRSFSLYEAKQRAVVVFPFILGVFVISIIIERLLNKKKDK